MSVAVKGWHWQNKFYDSSDRISSMVALSESENMCIYTIKEMWLNRQIITVCYMSIVE